MDLTFEYANTALMKYVAEEFNNDSNCPEWPPPKMTSINNRVMGPMSRTEDCVPCVIVYLVSS